MQDLLGVVAEMSWNDSDNCLNLTATCPLPANLPLTTALIAVGADPDHLLMTHGLPALSWAQKAQQPQSAAQVALPGQGNLQMPWQAPDAASFQLCIEPPEEDECRDAKLQLLAASALGTSHALTESSSQVGQSNINELTQLAGAYLSILKIARNVLGNRDIQSPGCSIQQTGQAFPAFAKLAVLQPDLPLKVLT